MQRKAKERLALAVTAVVALAWSATALASDGTWALTWGKDVDSVTGGTGFEVCAIAANCKAGSNSSAFGGEMNGTRGVAVGPNGDVYVGDSINNRVQEFGPSGSFVRAWGKDVVASGPDNTGTGPEICVAGVDTCKIGVNTTALGGEFAGPFGIAVDPSGNVYVADSGNQRIQKFDSTGHFLLAWGKDVAASGPDNTGTGPEICVAGVDVCQTGSNASAAGGEFASPQSVATDSSGNVYVGDISNLRVQKFNSSGAFLRAWGKDVVASGPDNTGTGPEICVAGVDTCQVGSNTTALGGEFANPSAVATDSAGNVYVADQANHRVQAFNSSGAFLRAWGKDVVASGPDNAGTGPEICVAGVDTCKTGVAGGLGGELNAPYGIAVDSANRVYAGDRGNNRIQVFDTSGDFLRAWGKDVIQSGMPGDTGTGYEVCSVAANCQAGVVGALGGEFNDPVEVAANGPSLYVAEAGNNRVQKFVDAAASSTGGGGTGAPSNLFTFGKLKGRALTLVLGSAGSVDVTDASVKGRLASVSKATRLLKHSHVSGGPGLVTVTLKLTAVAKKRLRHDGKVKVNAKVTFTPTGATKRTQTKLLKIKQ